MGKSWKRCQIFCSVNDPDAGPLCPEVEDYNIFFATMRKSGKDNSGEKIYVKRDVSAPVAEALEAGDASALPPEEAEKAEQTGEVSEYMLDEHGRLIVDHDLYNHDGLTRDGIAEAFIEFAKKENLSFFA